MPSPSRRIERINELIRAEISSLIAKELRAPEIGGVISVTEVQTTPDLRYAKVFVSILDEEEARQKTFAALQRATGFLRKTLAGRLYLRHMPELSLCLDESLQRGARVLSLLRELEGEKQ